MRQKLTQKEAKDANTQKLDKLYYICVYIYIYIYIFTG